MPGPPPLSYHEFYSHLGFAFAFRRFLFLPGCPPRQVFAFCTADGRQYRSFGLSPRPDIMQNNSFGSLDYDAEAEIFKSFQP